MLKPKSLYSFLLLMLCCLIVCTAEKFVHPDFSITEIMLRQRIAEISHPVIKENILSRPREFLESMKVLLALPGGGLLMVDKEHALPETYEPADLVSLDDYPVRVTKKSMFLRQLVMDDLLAMIHAAQEEDAGLIIASAYRSYEYQETLFNHWVKVLGPEQAERESARAGHSQHQLGTTVDFYPIDPGFKDTEAGKWLLLHASEYGFSLSFPEGYEHITGYIYEPWHYRYVGKGAAGVIDDYFLGVQQFFLEFYHNHAGFFREHVQNDPGSL